MFCGGGVQVCFGECTAPEVDIILCLFPPYFLRKGSLPESRPQRLTRLSGSEL